jgi:putative membrane protein
LSATGELPKEGAGASADPLARELMDARTRLAYVRTHLANERTQLAWVRTSLALISFGFSIATFFELIHAKEDGVHPMMQPHTVGILMVSIGLLALAISLVQHRAMHSKLNRECPGLPLSLSWMTATLIALLGLLALAATLLRR